MHHDFESRIDRSGTGSLKWDKYQGRDILPLWVADMDFRSPPCVDEALRARIDHGVYGYTIPYTEVEDAVLDYLKRDHGVVAEREWLVWMPGLVPALNTAARAFAEPGESVMTCSPVYPPFLSAPEWQGRELIEVPLAEHNGRFSFDFAAMERAVRPGTRFFILCNPHNPVGRVYTRAELDELAAFCQRHDLVLVSDEIHCDLILDARCRHIPALALDSPVAARSVTLMAPSKTYNLPGLACSFIIIPDAGLRNRFKRAARGMITEVNAFGYAACAAAYRGGAPWLRDLLEVLRANRDLLQGAVREHMPLLRMIDMEATYLAWIDVRGLGLENAPVFFEEHGVGLSDGAFFGAPGWLRVNFGCPRAVLAEGIARMRRAYDVATAR